MYIKCEVTKEIVIEKSKFIAYIKPCFSLIEYKEYLKEISKKHYDASHICSGFVSDEAVRSSDDGEPAGTAGVPILSALQKANLNNTCALVVRYFGGIKLGAGGLIRAYSQVVSEALKQASFKEKVLYKQYQIKLPYDLANKIEYLLDKESLNLTKDYQEDVTYTFLTNDHKLLDKIVELTSGKNPTYIKEEEVEIDV